MQQNSELVVSDTDPAEAEIVQLTQSTMQWFEYAQSALANGDQAEYESAVAVVRANLNELAKHHELTARVLGGLNAVIENAKGQIAQLTAENIQVFNELESRATDLAEAMTESEIEHIITCEECMDSAKVDYLAERMIDEGLDAIKEEQRDILNRQLREAEDIALHELGYGDTMSLFEEGEEVA